MAIRKTYILLNALLIAALGSVQADWQAEENVDIKESIAEDLYLAAETINVEAPLDGDLISASQTLTVSSEVGGDVWAVGDTLQFDAPLNDDLRSAGRSIRVSSTVNGHALLAGERVSVTHDARIEDWAWLAGRDVTINGYVGDNVRIAAQTVTINGEVNGDVTIHSVDVNITSNAKIRGDLTLHTRNEPTVSDDAAISGELTAKQTDFDEEESWQWIGGGLFGFVLSLTTLLVIFFIFPQAFKDASSEIQLSPGPSLGIGFATLILTPITALILFITGIGFALGLILILIFILLLVCASVAGYAFLASVGLALAGQDHQPTALRWLIALLLAFTLMQLIQWVPLLGGLAAFVLFLFGLGAFVRAIWKRFQEAW